MNPSEEIKTQHSNLRTEFEEIMELTTNILETLHSIDINKP